MVYEYITCSKCSPLADSLTHMPAVACSRPNQLECSSQVECIFKHWSSFLASIAACDKTPALPPNVIIILWTLGATRHWT